MEVKKNMMGQKLQREKLPKEREKNMQDINIISKSKYLTTHNCLHLHIFRQT